jgi:(1->4)-alpha-D-glucan 1-alpha-D-glucosylmutase
VIDVTHRAIDAPGFAARFLPFLDQVVDAGERIALGGLVLRALSPGVPDVYQGDELWNLLLVDPDNRRPVDWDLRRTVLDKLRAGDQPERSSAKLLATMQLLALRARFAGFEGADYRPLEAPPGLCAFGRGDAVVAVVPIRPAAELVTPAQLGVPGAGWVDVLEPLAAFYGARRPGVFVRGEG